MLRKERKDHNGEQDDDYIPLTTGRAEVRGGALLEIHLLLNFVLGKVSQRGDLLRLWLYLLQILEDPLLLPTGTPTLQ